MECGHAKTSRTCKRLLKVTATCRRQDRNVLDYVTAAVEAKLNGTVAPSLLPIVSTVERPTQEVSELPVAA